MIDKLYAHQIDMLRGLQGGARYLIAEPRTGKTRPAIAFFGCRKVLVLTKLAGIPGWLSELDEMGVGGYTVVNYEKLRSKNWDMAEEWDGLILDECHVLSKYPKPCLLAPIISKLIVRGSRLGISATPCAESYSQLFHQAKALRMNLWKECKNFYAFHRKNGIKNTLFVHGRQQETYKVCRPEILAEFHREAFVMERQKAVVDFVEAKNHIIYFEDADLVSLQKQIMSSGIITVDGKEVIAETKVAAAQKAHQISGGTVLREVSRTLVRDRDGKVKRNKAGEPITRALNESLILSRKKVQLIREALPGIKLAILTFFKAEIPLIASAWPNGQITSSPDTFQSDPDMHFIGSLQKFSRAVDLSAADAIVMYSIPWSAECYIQGRERLLKRSRKAAASVYFPLLRGGIDEAIYQRVAVEKVDFHSTSYSSIANPVGK